MAAPHGCTKMAAPVGISKTKSRVYSPGDNSVLMLCRNSRPERGFSTGPSIETTSNSWDSLVQYGFNSEPVEEKQMLNSLSNWWLTSVFPWFFQEIAVIFDWNMLKHWLNIVFFHSEQWLHQAQGPLHVICVSENGVFATENGHFMTGIMMMNSWHLRCTSFAKYYLK